MVKTESLDPFDLPDWLGTDAVVWVADRRLEDDARVSGVLRSAERTLPCDLLAVDEAYPVAVVAEGLRSEAHRAWRYGEVLAVLMDDRLTLLMTGTRLSTDDVLSALGRLARAVGADPGNYAAELKV